jgi:carbon monoxide dehydrogenase subunit G
MAWFTASTTSDGVVSASREEVWAVLTDAATVARLTPFVRTIEADGDRWRWEMTSVPVLGRGFTPCFTERMVFDRPARIDYTHDPPEGHDERTGVEGTYLLTETPRGTHLSIELHVSADLPLPRASGPAVRTAMRAVMGTMGIGFERAFRRELGEP